MASDQIEIKIADLSKNLLWEIFRYCPTAVFWIEMLNKQLNSRMGSDPSNFHSFLEEIFVSYDVRDLNYQQCKTLVNEILNRNHQHLICMKGVVGLYNINGRLEHEMEYHEIQKNIGGGSFIFINRNEILACGGRHSNATNQLQACIYSIESYQSRQVSDMNNAHCRHGIVWYQSRVYIFGGYGTLISEFYEAQHDKWTCSSPLPCQILFAFAAVHNHNIYVTGQSHVLVCYNPKTEEFDQLSISLTERRNKLLVSHGNSLLVLDSANHIAIMTQTGVDYAKLNMGFYHVTGEPLRKDNFLYWMDDIDIYTFDIESFQFRSRKLQ